MKGIFITAFLFAGLHAVTQESVLLNREFWTGKPDVATVKAELAKGFDFKSLAGTADPILLAINNDAPTKVIRLLTDQPGVDLKRTLMEGRIYLHVAAHKHNAPITDYLLAKGSDMYFLDANKYKCMIQLNAYTGPASYIVVSLINKNDEYEKTLYVMGDDKKWYPDLKAWHSAYQKKPVNIDAITGASVAGGDRAVVILDIDRSRINAGYKIRFESAVEHQPYYHKDAEIPLTTEGLSAKTEGKGFIGDFRYVQGTVQQELPGFFHFQIVGILKDSLAE
ncbi:MAG: hypothetical protein ABS46_00635 [Cytophagaceae bacterium SCN 52-12]|nr:MAG: hypothetical protein ABS46_00635 [Cytophagaceae bacterium SCN 52-12]